MQKLSRKIDELDELVLIGCVKANGNEGLRSSRHDIDQAYNVLLEFKKEVKKHVIETSIAIDAAAGLPLACLALMFFSWSLRGVIFTICYF